MKSKCLHKVIIRPSKKSYATSSTKAPSMLPLGHGVALVPIWVLYSHAGLVGTTEDLSSQMTKLRYHVIDQVIQVTCEVT